MNHVEHIVMCGCNGCPCSGATCGYIAVGGEYCKAPENYECEYKDGNKNKAVN